MSGVVLWLMYPCQFGQRNCNRAKQDICSLLGITTLLGITWGLVFFSFGQLTTAALYSFSILNSLQGLLNLPQFKCIQYITAMRTSHWCFNDTTYSCFEISHPSPNQLDYAKKLKAFFITKLQTWSKSNCRVCGFYSHCKNKIILYIKQKVNGIKPKSPFIYVQWLKRF